MSSNELKTCPACKHQNKADAKICENCKRVLSTITTAVTERKDLDVPDEHSLAHAAQKIRPGILTLLFPGEANPLTMEIQDEMVLGRSVPGSTTPTVDLSPYSATVLGVSRNHAMIKFKDGEAAVIDQGSSNGTWVNQKHIAPYTDHKLRSGDLLRLGNMLIFAYFSSAPPAKRTILLVNTSKKALLSRQQHLTLADITEHITPYLNAIFELQSILNLNEDDRAPAPGIDYINWSMAHRGVQVRLQNVDELVEFLNTQFQVEAAPQPDATETADTGALEPLPAETTQAVKPVKKDTEQLNSDEDKTAPAKGSTGTLARPRPSQQELTKAIIQKFAATLPEIGQNNLIQRLKPHIETLLESQFDLYVIRNS